MNADTNKVERVIGFDSHPDTFTAAILRGPTPLAAIVEKTFDKLPMDRLRSWANKHTTEKDLIVLEASGNSFHVVRVLAKIGRKALVLESAHLGKLKEGHANNDKISAVRIGKAYLSGTARTVWVPDLKTQEQRDLLHIHRKAVKRTTQLANRILSYLSDQGVRGFNNLQTIDFKKVLKARPWTSVQEQILRIYGEDLDHAQKQRKAWESIIAQQVLASPQMLNLVRLLGIREITAFACLSFIGDINRFKSPDALVNYIGLSPAFDDSGNDEWTGKIGRRGRKELRFLLIQGAHAVLRTEHYLGKWGRKVMARKSNVNIAVAAVARKMAVAVWYMLMGKWENWEELAKPLKLKIGKIISKVGEPALNALGKTRSQYREEVYQEVQKSRDYVLDPNKKMPPREKVSTRATKELVE